LNHALKKNVTKEYCWGNIKGGAAAMLWPVMFQCIVV